MIVAVAQETFPGEKRVALVPAILSVLAKAGLEVVIQRGAGESSGYPDSAYRDKGARIVASRDEAYAADVVLQVRAAGANPQDGEDDHGRLKPGSTLIAMADPLGSPQAARRFAQTGATLFALELVPRITRAQSMDVLSSMATVAGYRAVLLAATALPKMFPMLMTAAGTITPAKVLVVGAGVAGLQAIATARRLGAVVSAYDVRPAVKEQVRSLGAKFLEIEVDTSAAEDQGGYARQLDEETIKKQREMMARAVAQSDAVITTAAVPGKKAPVLITAEMVSAMSPTAVIVDLAAERGGNCELTVPGQTVEHQGVRILGPSNLPSEIPFHASQMFAKNVATFLVHLVDQGQWKLDPDDEIVRDTLVCRGGRVVHPRVCELLGIEPPEAPAPAPEAEKDTYEISEGGDR